MRQLEELRRRIAELEAAQYEARQKEQVLQDALTIQKAILDNIPDMAWLKDRKGRFVAVNARFAEARGLTPERLLGKTDFDFWPPELAQRYVNDDLAVMKSGRRKVIEEPLVHVQGEPVWIETIKSPIYNSDGKVIGTTGISRDITERKRTAEILRELATTDGLTKLFNRGHFMEAAEHEFQRSNRYGHALSLLMIDVDHFKSVNDTYGHRVGDSVLQFLAKLLLSNLRTVDSLGRIGGEEFAALLPETGRADALVTAERLRVTVANEPIPINGGSLRVTISLGAAATSNATPSLDALIGLADAALYQAKNNGRNRVEAM